MISWKYSVLCRLAIGTDVLIRHTTPCLINGTGVAFRHTMVVSCGCSRKLCWCCRPLDEQQASVKQRIHQFESEESESSPSPEQPKPRKQRPKSKAFELFETQGIIIGMVSGGIFILLDIITIFFF